MAFNIFTKANTTVCNIKFYEKKSSDFIVEGHKAQPHIHQQKTQEIYSRPISDVYLSSSTAFFKATTKCFCYPLFIFFLLFSRYTIIFQDKISLLSFLYLVFFTFCSILYLSFLLFLITFIFFYFSFHTPRPCKYPHWIDRKSYAR